MFKDCYLKLIKLAGQIDRLLLRYIAFFYFQLSIIGLLWFADITFSREYLFDTAMSAIPLLSFLVGIVTPDKWLQRKPYFILHQIFIIVGVPCIAVSTVKSLTFLDTPSYSTFALRLVSLLVLLILFLRAAFVRKNKINVSNVGTSDQSTGSGSIDPKNPFL